LPCGDFDTYTYTYTDGWTGDAATERRGYNYRREGR
jgi:hypothetical protein